MKSGRVFNIQTQEDIDNLAEFTDPDELLERFLLGRVFQVGESAYREISFLAGDDFADKLNAIVYRAIQKVVADGRAPTFGEVQFEIEQTGQFSDVGGMDRLMKTASNKKADLSDIQDVGLPRLAETVRTRAITRRQKTSEEKLSLEIQLYGFRSAEVQRTIEDIQALQRQSESPAIGRGIGRIEDLPMVGEYAEPISYLREPEVPRGAVIGLTGDSGSGKSTIATAWARDAIRQGAPVLILDRESPKAIAIDRMKRLGLEDSPQLRWWGGWVGDVPSPANQLVLGWVRACAAKPLIIVDSLVAFLEGDENDACHMRRFMQVLRGLADAGATVIIIHHDGKSETARDFRGSSDFKAGVDQAFHVNNLTSDGKLERLTLRCFKSRYGFVGSVVYRYASGKFVRDEARDAVARTVSDRLTDLLRQNPGIGVKKFEDLAAKQGLGRNKARDFLGDGVLGGLIRRELGGRNQFRHYLPESPK